MYIAGDNDDTDFDDPPPLPPPLNLPGILPPSTSIQDQSNLMQSKNVTLPQSSMQRPSPPSNFLPLPPTDLITGLEYEIKGMYKIETKMVYKNYP